MPVPGDDLTAMKIREQAHIIWRKVSHQDKHEWEHLFTARHSDPGVYRKGRKLLENGNDKIWGVFKPVNIHGVCTFCGEICQHGDHSSCRFARVIGSQ